jgi:mannose-1-phosphate guanylyltransferase/mannose-6-phosphate isomerase
MALVPIILSGGAGTRLWPLSREAAPKPFMPMPDGETLLGKTALRAAALTGVAGLVTITNRDYYFHTRDVYSAAGIDLPRWTYLLEPFGRNTAPAVALGALYCEAVFGGDATMLVLPADHLIRDGDAFAAAVERATSLARAGWLTTFGIGPTHPETGYGYIECGEPLGVADAFRVRRFIEKPPLADATAYLETGRHVWNSGMFCFTPMAILAAFAEHAPVVIEAARAVWQALRPQADAAMLEIDPALFAAVPDISIDYAVMEKAGNVAVIRGAFDWSDVGSWQAISALTAPDADGNRGQGERVAIDTHNTFVHAEDRIVATVGIENLVIVDTPDAVLVAHRDHVQRVREVVGELKARGHDAYKLHRTVARPWGAYTVLLEGPGFKIKRIEVKPGGKLSLQLHHRRSEHWVVVSGDAHVTNGERVYTVRTNESTFIPPETRHRLENKASEPLVMIEVQCGDYLGEDDIVRFDDQYGRVKA